MSTLSTDYAMHEYGVTAAELTAFEKRMMLKIEQERKAGRLREFNGDIEAVVTNQMRR